MKKLNFKVTSIVMVIVLSLFYACNTESNDLTIANKSFDLKIQKTSMYTDNELYSHNFRIKKIIHQVENDGCNVTSEELNNIIKNEFSSELEKLRNHKYFDIFNSPKNLFIVSKLIQINLIFKDHSINFEKYDTKIIEMYNEVINEIPSCLKLEIPIIYQKLKGKTINRNNYLTFFQGKFDELNQNNNLTEKEKLIIETYFVNLVETYTLWSSSEKGGLDYYNNYKECLMLSDNLQLKIDDNDWPNGATTPDWMNDDVIGGVAGAAVGGSWWGIVVAAVSSSIMTAN